MALGTGEQNARGPCPRGIHILVRETHCELRFQAAKKIKPDDALGRIRLRLLWLENLNEGRPRPHPGISHTVSKLQNPEETEGEEMLVCWSTPARGLSSAQETARGQAASEPARPACSSWIRIGSGQVNRPASSCFRAFPLLLDKPLWAGKIPSRFTAALCPAPPATSDSP